MKLNIICVGVLIFLSACTTPDFTELGKESEGKFLAVMGVGMIVPGVDDYHSTYKGKIEINYIPGTSDVYSGARDKIYNDSAYVGKKGVKRRK